MGKKALYLQIYEELRERIGQGVLPPGAKLSQRHIASEFQVSKKTASEALALLEGEGMVVTHARSGTIVSNNAWMLVDKGSATDWNTYIESGIQIPSREKIFMFLNDLSSHRRIHISGPRISKEFNYASYIRKTLRYVEHRLENSDDLNQIDIKGLYSLRETICFRLASLGIPATPEEVLITTGMTESLAIISWAFLRSGMTFVQDTPSILNSMQVIRSSGTNIVQIPLDNEGMQVEPLNRTLKNATRVLLYTNPVNHYPTGISYSKPRRDKLMSICFHAGIPVIENDMLRDFWLDKPHPRPMKAFDKGGQIIYIGCLIGVNIGLKLSWIVAPKYLIRRLSDVKNQYDTNTNNYLQITVDELFKSGCYDEFLDSSRPLFRQTLETAYGIIEEYLGPLIKPLHKNYGFYIWVTFEKDINMLDIYACCQEIMFLPGYFFDSTDVSSLHLAPFADTIDNFREAVKIIANQVKIHLKKL